MKMQISSSNKGKIRVITLVGQFWQKEDLKAFESAVEDSIREGICHAVIDIDHLSFVNSMGLGMFVNAYRRFTDAGGVMVLYKPRSGVLEMLEVSGFEEFMPIAGDQSELEKYIPAD
jgi:anti-anti-sigma factor